jgi:hypothetical protein
MYLDEFQGYKAHFQDRKLKLNMLMANQQGQDPLILLQQLIVNLPLK